MQLWRMNLKPESVQGVDAAAFCINQGVLGIGWRLDAPPASREDYWSRGEATFAKFGRSWSASANAVLYRMQTGDLVWTRDCRGTYFLGRISGDWEYRATQEYQDADIINVRPCEWRKVGTMDYVPGAVINGFRAQATVQAVYDVSATLYSQFLFADLSGEKFNNKGGDLPEVINLLSPDDLEDVVAVYLQVEHGYLMFPSTCKIDTMAVECVFVAPETGARVGLQVRSGQLVLDRKDYQDFEGLMYLFAASGIYTGSENPRCHCIPPSVIAKFMNENRKLMPGRVQKWLKFGDRFGGT